MELLLIRHGLPVREESRDGTAVDPGLSEVGLEQAERLAHWLEADGIAALYSSPMRRARETAAPLARRIGVEPAVRRGLVELDHQSERYVPLEEIKLSEPDRWRELVHEGGLYAGVDVPTFRAQVSAALGEIIDAHPGERVAVTCHAGVINAWLTAVLGVEELFVFEPAYTSVSRFLAASSGKRSLHTLNETPHLRSVE